MNRFLSWVIIIWVLLWLFQGGTFSHSDGSTTNIVPGGTSNDGAVLVRNRADLVRRFFCDHISMKAREISGQTVAPKEDYCIEGSQAAKDAVAPTGLDEPIITVPVPKIEVPIP